MQEEFPTVKKQTKTTATNVELENLVSTLQDDIKKYSVEIRLKEDFKEMKIIFTKANSFHSFCETAKTKRGSNNDLENSSQNLEN